jgi:hypothetical protein
MNGSIHLLVDYLLLYWVYSSTGGLFITLLGLYSYWWILYSFTGTIHLLVDYLLLYWVYASTDGLFITLLGLYIYWWIIYYFTHNKGINNPQLEA